MLKNKRIVVLALVVAMIVALLPMSTVYAAEAPKEETIGGKKCFFANGNAITISEPTTEGKGATISWNGGAVEVDADVTVFGGMHNNSTPVTASITMTGGTVKNIIGGGLHTSNTTNVEINVTGGNLTSVQGGGAAAFVATCTEDACKSSYTPNDSVKADVTTSPCQVGTAVVNISGNTKVSSTIYGGGQGFSNTDKATVNLSGNVTALWVTAGGSNGRTGEAILNITGGTYDTVQAGNRGVIDEATVTIENATIETLYTSSGDTETTKEYEVPAIAKSTVTIVEGSTVSTLLDGANTATNLDVEVTYDKGTVTDDSGVSVGEVAEIIKVTVNGTEYELEVGKTLADVEGIEDEKVKEGHTFKGFVKKGTTEFIAETTALTDNISVDSLFEVNTYKVTVNGKEYTAEHGTALGDIEGLISDIQKDGFVIVTVKDATGKEYMPDDVVTGDMNLVVVYEPEGLGDNSGEGESEAQPEDDNSEENVDTADNITSYVAIVAFAVVGFAIMFTVVRKNKVSKK